MHVTVGGPDGAQQTTGSTRGESTTVAVGHEVDQVGKVVCDMYVIICMCTCT